MFVLQKILFQVSLRSQFAAIQMDKMIPTVQYCRCSKIQRTLFVKTKQLQFFFQGVIKTHFNVVFEKEFRSIFGFTCQTAVLPLLAIEQLCLLTWKKTRLLKTYPSCVSRATLSRAFWQALEWERLLNPILVSQSVSSDSLTLLGW